MTKEFFTAAAQKEKATPKMYTFGNRMFTEQELIDFANTLSEFNKETDSFNRVNDIAGAKQVLGAELVKEVSPTNKNYFEDGGLIEDQEEKLQLPYHSASNVCTSMDTVVPASMAVEQRKFNDRLRSAVAELGLSVEAYVAKKLHYRSVEELCFQDRPDASGNKVTRFSAEQIDAIGTAIWNYENGDNGIIIADQTGTGKGRSQPLDSKVLSPYGFVRMGDLKVGDKVISVDGTATKVLGIFPQGKIEVFEITFSDGSKTQCSADHLWSTIYKEKKSRLGKNGKMQWDDFDVMQTKDIAKRIKKSHEIPVLSQPVQFKPQKIKTDPYLLGALLGNGCVREHSIQLISNDSETINRVSGLIDKSLKIWKTSSRKYHYNIVQKKPKQHGDIRNKLVGDLKILGLSGKRSYEKFIPESYKINSTETRIAVLQGLMDTDGYADKRTGTCNYATASKQLCDDIVFIVRSLGGVTSVHTKKPTYTYKGQKLKGRISYIITIKLPNSIAPFRLKRKAERVVERTKYFPQRVIRSIKSVGKKECQCIKVAHPSSLYVTDDFIVTHNTAAGLLRYAILDLKVVPFFFTEKKHLINDIYRDLIAIGFDAGVPYKFRKVEKIESPEFTDEEIFKIIIQDIKDRDDVRIDFSFPEEFELSLLRKKLNEDSAQYDEVEEIKQELIEAYRQHFMENGFERDVYELNVNYKQDVVDAMRSGKMLVEPFVPNLIDIKDVDGNIIYEAISKKEADAIYKIKGKKTADKDLDVSSLILPAKYKLFCMPYSQVASGFENIDGISEPKNKTKLFLKYSLGSVIVLDESHNASGITKEGLSQTGQVVFKMVRGSKLTTYLSATYAKRADNMPLYALKTSIRECGLSDNEMIDAFMKGGNALQEAVSAELSRNGQLLRREKQIQGKSEYYYENEGSEVGDNQILKLNRVATLYKSVLDFSGQVRQVIREYKKGLPKDEADKIKQSRSVNALTFQLFNFMLLGLKLRQTTEFAIKKLSSGKKTVITVASTMESALDNLSKTFLSNSGKDSYKIGDKIKNDFSLYMAYLLNYTMRYNIVDVKVNDDGEEEETKQLVYILDSNDEVSTAVKDRLLSQYEKILGEILEFETGIPIAPIDMIEKAIKDAGFSVSEITGRQRKISFSGDSTQEGTITKRDIRKTDVVVREFNENELDCLIINQSGATGISMHSLPNTKVNVVYKPSMNEAGEVTDNAPTSLSNKKEVKKRAMIITQMELDINKEVQKLGRINRMGQVYQPEYTYIISAIPSESRLTSLMEKKLRSLSANVSSNSTQASYLFTADDFFSDVAVAPFNETMQDVGMRNVTVTTGSQIQDFTKTLYFKDYKLQKDFYDTFSKKLQKEIETLKSQGLYTAKMSYKEYYAETLYQFPFYLGDNNSKTSFGRHSVIEKVSVKLYKERFTENKISQHITDGLVLKTSGLAEESKPFGKLSEFQKAATQQLSDYEIQKKDLTEIASKQNSEEIEKRKKEIATHESELKKYGELEKAIAIEEKLKVASTKSAEIIKGITEAAGSGNIEKVQEYTTELAAIQGEEKALKEAIKPYEEILKTKGEHKAIIREIKELNDKIESLQKRENKLQEAMLEYTRLVVNSKKYISKIGSVCELSVYEEEEGYYEEGEKVKYKAKFTAPVVITGVSFPGSYSELTPGQVEIKMSGVSEKFAYNLYRLEKELEQHEKERGVMPLERIEFVGENYKDRWNEIAGKHDNSYRENRYMIIGSLLKTFALGKSNEISGQIVKYNTIDNKNRIGIEVANNENAKDGQKSVYKILEERYSEESVQEKPIYYDGNMTNVKRFIEEYAYHLFYGEAYSNIEKNLNPADTGRLGVNAPKTVGFQISSSKQEAFVLIITSEEDRQNSSNLNRMYNQYDWANKKGTAQEILSSMQMGVVSIEEFTSRLQVQIISDNISASDFMAWHFQKATGIQIGPENYMMAGKSKNFPDAQKVHGKQIDRYRPGWGSQFKTFFPTNIITLEHVISHGTPYNTRLSMSYGDFIKLIKHLEKQRMKPTFATSSGYFEKYKGEYVFEQFADEENVSTTQEVVGGGADYMSGADEEINEMIDALVKEVAEI